MPQRVYPQQKFGNEMYIIVRANGDEFVCVFEMQNCCNVFTIQGEKFVAKLLCYFWVIDFFLKEKTKYSTNQKLLCKYFLFTWHVGGWIWNFVDVENPNMVSSHTPLPNFLSHP